MSSANRSIVDDQLTTDACPSPPRQDEDIPADNSAEMPREKTYVPEDIPKPKTAGFRPKKCTKASANIIHINNSNGIQIGSNYIINMAKNKNEEPQEVVKTKVISALLSSKEPVTKDHISFISTHIGARWKDVARTFKYSEGQIEQFHIDNIDAGIKEVVYQMLRDWIQNDPDEATLGKLCSALWDTHQKDAVRRFAEDYKT